MGVCGRGCRKGRGFGLDGSLAAGLDLEQQLFVDVFASEDARTGVAAFREHGPGHATFRGR